MSELTGSELINYVENTLDSPESVCEQYNITGEARRELLLHICAQSSNPVKTASATLIGIMVGIKIAESGKRNVQ